jgi:alpha-galactosidase
MRENIVLIGAGSAVFTRGLVADLIAAGAAGRLALVDIDPDALGVAEALARKMIRARRAPLRLSADVDRRAVLPGATVIVTTIAVGGRRAWERDVLVPRTHGIFQPVGDSVMPGGTSRALRMIPAMVAIARDIAELAPRALFFNYANPMACICRAVRKATDAPVIGLCHGVPETVRHIAAALDLEPAGLRYTAAGINHLTWLTGLSAGGRDLMPRLRALAREKTEAARRTPHAEPAPDRFAWELTDLFGAFPAPLDRHVTEFFPHLFARRDAYYGRTLGLDACSFEETIARGDERYERMRRQARSAEPLPDEAFGPSGGEHEQLVDVIRSIRAADGRVWSANVPNTGQIPNLPETALVECPCASGQGGLRPLPLPPLDPALAGTLATRFQWVEATVEAALTGDGDRLRQALILDGAVASLDQARRLADDLLAAQRDHLPQLAGT